jgi:hypothetical protein
MDLFAINLANGMNDPVLALAHPRDIIVPQFVSSLSAARSRRLDPQTGLRNGIKPDGAY